MPSLTYLKLIGNGNFCDGHRWEQFIQTNLPLLEKFKFVFNEDRTNQDNNPPDIELIIASFQTPFWVQFKKWFVNCEYNMNSPERITLCSISIYVPSINSNTEPIKVSVWTLGTTNSKNAHILVSNNKIGFNFTKLTSSDIEQQVSTNQNIIQKFRTIENVVVMFDLHRPVGWVQFVSLFINLTTTKNIILEGKLILNGNPDILVDIKILLQQACNVSSVTLCRAFSTRKSLLTANDICSIIPAHIQYLTVTIKDFHEAIIVLDRLKHLLTANFFFDQTLCYDKVHEWFKTKKQHFSYRTETLSLCVWRKKKTNSLNELTISNKRIKLDNDHRE